MADTAMNELNLPTDWKTFLFTNCLRKGKIRKKPSIPKRDYQESGEFPVIDQGASFIAGWTDSVESVIFDNLPVVIFGDHTRIFKYVDFPFALGADGTQLLYPNDDILNPHFFYYALLNLKVPNKGYNRHYRYLREFSIVCPPLPEQRAIARVLQAIQEAKLTRHREIALERERKAALMEELFSYGTKGEPRKQTEIGKIPDSWEIIQLAKIADVRAGGAFPIKYQGNKKGEYPFYKVSDMNIRGNETLMYRSNNWVEVDTIKTLKAKIFPKNTVIFPKVGAAVHTNKKRVLSIDGLVDNNVMGVTIRDENLCIPYYLLYWFESIDLGDLSNPGPLPAITAGKIKSTEIPLPLISEQRTIAEILQAFDTKIAALEQETQYLDELFHAMLDELMTGQRSALPLVDTECHL